MKNFLFIFLFLFPVFVVAETAREDLDALRYRALSGDSESLLRLGEIYDRGEGGPADRRLALCYYWASAQSGCDSAKERMAALGELWRLGEAATSESVALADGVKIDFVRVPAGKFFMGSPESEAGRKERETRVPVTISKPFLMSRTEVTQEQYFAVIGANPSAFKGESNLPVETVTWADAMRFCAKLTALERAAGRLPENEVYTLPTNAQWEYACRAGTTTRYNSGDSECDLSRVAWYDKNSGGKTHPVGQKAPNGWGLYDMHGNVWEWVLDGNGKNVAGEDPLLFGFPACRGGCFPHPKELARSAYMLPSNGLDARGRDLGFRIVRVETDRSPVSGTQLTTAPMRRAQERLAKFSEKERRERTQDLLRAWQCRDLVAAEVALARGADPDVFVHSPQSPTILENAVYENRMDFLELLLCYGANPSKYNVNSGDPNNPDSGNKRDPFTTAVIDRKTSGGLVALLCDYGFPVHGRNAWKSSPLVDSLNHRAPVLAMVLKFYGASETLPDGNGTTAKKLARGNAVWEAIFAIPKLKTPTYGNGRTSILPKEELAAAVKAREEDERHVASRREEYLANAKKIKHFVTKLDGGVEMRFVPVPAGTFTMGSPKDEPGRRDDEAQVQVRISKDFWLGRTEVTQAQFKAVMGYDPSLFDGADLPAERVTWDSAVEFCAKLTARDHASKKLPSGWVYALPTEAQWEYACRAGTTTRYYFGDVDLGLHLFCNFYEISGNRKFDENYRKANGLSYRGDLSQDDGYGATAPVGKYCPNAWGLYDMHGNVYEWCADYYNPSLADGTDPCRTTPGSGTYGSSRVFRGGGWFYVSSDCRSANRSYDTDRWRSLGVGFRVAIVPADSANGRITQKKIEELADLNRRIQKNNRAMKEKTRTADLGDGVILELVRIPAGTFVMGSPKDEEGRGDNENQVRVTISKPFYLGKYEVTQTQWQAVMGNNPSEFKGENLPVTDITWGEANAFCAKLTKRERAAKRIPENMKYALPMEAQWEYACRAGTTTRFCFGDDRSSFFCYGNFNDKACQEKNKPWRAADSAEKIWNDGYAKTAPVGSFRPNAWGLYDMHGNVWERCADYYNPELPMGTDPCRSTPGRGENGSRYIIRGGSYWYATRFCRSSQRMHNAATDRFADTGFRVALVEE